MGLRFRIFPGCSLIRCMVYIRVLFFPSFCPLPQKHKAGGPEKGVVQAGIEVLTSSVDVTTRVSSHRDVEAVSKLTAATTMVPSTGGRFVAAQNTRKRKPRFLFVFVAFLPCYPLHPRTSTEHGPEVEGSRSSRISRLPTRAAGQ